MVGRKRMKTGDSLERLEGRDVMSGLLVALQATTPILTPAQVTTLASGISQTANPSGQSHVSAKAVTNTSGLYIGNGSGGTGQPSGPNAAATFPSSPIAGMGTPTKAELAREKFVAKFTGPMSTKPGRFSDQASIIYLRGLGGSTANFFLRGDYSLAIVIPAGFNSKNPTALNPATGQPLLVTGFAFLDDKNNNSGGVVGLDLLADPTSFDAKGRPTRLTFTSDPNVYGGIFFVDSAAGVVSISYGKNTATSSFNGRIYTSGLTSPFQNVDLFAKHSG